MNTQKIQHKTIIPLMALTCCTNVLAANTREANSNYYTKTRKKAPVAIHSEKGFYLEGNIGITNNNYKYLKQFQTSWGGNLGYQFNKHFAIEGNYINSRTSNQFGVAGKVILPVNNKFEVYGKLGYNRNAMAAVGASYYIKPKLSLSYEASYTHDEYTRNTVGIGYHFRS